MTFLGEGLQDQHLLSDRDYRRDYRDYRKIGVSDEVQNKRQVQRFNLKINSNSLGLGHSSDTGWLMTSCCRAVRYASLSWTLLWHGSSESRWPCRSFCRLCGTLRSAGGPGGTGCVAAAPPRKFSTFSCKHPPPHGQRRRRGGDKKETDLYLFLNFFFYDKKLKCVCVRACVCYNYLCSFWCLN